METEVVWTKRAGQNLKNIFDYIAFDSLYYAERFVAKLVVSVEKQLMVMPLTGRFVPELANTPFHFLREVVFRNYRVIYSAEKLPFTITIIAVVHAKQNILKIPAEEWVIQS